MTIEAIAAQAGVAAPTVYAAFGSKTGILVELLDQSTFGPDYENLVYQARDASEPEMRLRIAAKIARQIHDAASSTLDLLKGAGVVAPQLARLLKDRETKRYKAQEHLIDYLQEHRKLKVGLGRTAARDVLWSFTSRELYRLLVIERAWTSQAYEDWLGDTLLLTLIGENRS
jgi:AcrR family transcriptional regulator